MIIKRNRKKPLFLSLSYMVKNDGYFELLRLLALKHVSGTTKWFLVQLQYYSLNKCRKKIISIDSRPIKTDRPLNTCPSSMF